MGYAIPKQIVLETTDCYKCGVEFAMPDNLLRQFQHNGGTFYCPNGHGQIFAKSEVQRLREKLDEQTRAATRMADRAASAEASEQKAQRKITRIMKRTHAGVCPCCNRTFQQLARHMKTKHPDVTE